MFNNRHTNRLTSMRAATHRSWLFVGLLMTGLTNVAAAEWPPAEYRVSTGVGEFTHASQAAVAFRLRSPQLLKVNHLEFAVGTFTTEDDSTWFASFGPVWRFSKPYNRTYFEFGLSPTVLNDPGFAGHDLGGKFHFTSSATVGFRFNERAAVALRLQHTSNGGLNGTNPGLDMLGLNFTYDFSHQR